MVLAGAFCAGLCSGVKSVGARSNGAVAIANCPRIIRVVLEPAVATSTLTLAIAGWFEDTPGQLSLFVGDRAVRRASTSADCTQGPTVVAWVHLAVKGGVLLLAKRNDPNAPFAKRELSVEPPLTEVNAEQVAQAMHSLIADYDAGETELFPVSDIQEQLPPGSELSDPPMVEPLAETEPEAPTKPAAEAPVPAPTQDLAPAANSLQLALLLGYELRVRGPEPLFQGPRIALDGAVNSHWGLLVAYHQGLPGTTRVQSLELTTSGPGVEVSAALSPFAGMLWWGVGAGVEWPQTEVTSHDPMLAPSREAAAPRSAAFSDLSLRIPLGQWLVIPRIAVRYALRATVYTTEIDGERSELMRAWRWQPSMGLNVGYAFGKQ